MRHTHTRLRPAHAQRRQARRPLRTAHEDMHTLSVSTPVINSYALFFVVFMNGKAATRELAYGAGAGYASENTATGAWQPSCSRSCSPARAFKACNDKADGWRPWAYAISARWTLREYIGHLRYRWGQKDRTDPSVGRSRVRESGTSGHAAAH